METNTPTEERNNPGDETRSPAHMTNMAERRERRDAAAHRQRIVAAARELFAAKGVDGTTMHDIARRAGVGQGTLYRRYAHKGELCGDLLADSARRFRDEVAPLVDNDGASRPPLARLDDVLTRLMAFNEENGALLGAIVDAACGERRSGPYDSPFYRWLRSTVVVLMEEAVEAGEAAPLDVAGTADVVLGMLSIDLYLYQRNVLGHTPERITAAVRHLLFAGLRARDAATV